MQQEMKGRVRKIMQDTINFPKELLFISRNMNLVRSLNKYYRGVAPRIPIMAHAAFIGSTFEHSYSNQFSIQRCRDRLDTITKASSSILAFGLWN